jgi:hypothetical protein
MPGNYGNIQKEDLFIKEISENFLVPTVIKQRAKTDIKTPTLPEMIFPRLTKFNCLPKKSPEKIEKFRGNFGKTD